MAKPEQTEKPTPKRRSESRQEGRVAKSQDISQACVFLAAVIVLHLWFIPGIDAVAQMMVNTFQHVHEQDPLNIHSVFGVFVRAFLPLVVIVSLLLATSAAVGIFANMAQVGFLFTLKPIKPKFSALNPIAGFKRIFISKQTIINLLKQILKLVAVGIIVYGGLADQISRIYTIAHLSQHDLLMLIDSLIYGIGLRYGIVLLLLGILDYFYQRHELEDSMKMTKQEVKDEAKQSEGPQEAKQAVKKRQREFARKRMMQAVPKATVVVTNPTHFAIALEWDETKMAAPVVTAKGADLMARRIREIAKEHNIPIMENPPLARTLYERVDLDTPIPPNLYAAVAQVIAFVYRLKSRTIA
jgi:flagellar biosynthetic protein FlhB